MSKYLCNCIACLQLKFENYEHLTDSKTISLSLKNPGFNLDENNVVMFDEDYEDAFSSMVYYY